jgi:DUF438 domain-containing protein
MMEMNAEVLAAILDAYPYRLVFCDREHIVRYMNKDARARYGKVLRVGDSIFGCHNSESIGKIQAFLARADAGEDEMLEAVSKERKEREFFTPVRDQNGTVIGYFERHEDYWELGE